MTVPLFETFEDFWPFYVHEHANKVTRLLHFAGTTTGLVILAKGIITGRPWLLAAALLAGYGPAWFAHFVIEKNKPATFHHPIWSLRADFRMLGMMLDGTMDAEVERVMRERPWERNPNGQSASAHGSNGRSKHNASTPAHETLN